MRFYYWSFLNWIPITIFYVIAAVVLWILWRLIKDDKNAKYLIWGLIPLMLILPWTEELWIAERFDRLCRKDAGIFIEKTVEADGFYDGTLQSAYENTRPGKYLFVEQVASDGEGFERVERAGPAVRDKALTWYDNNNPGKARPTNKAILYPISDRETIVVSIDGTEAWRVIKLDQPTAKYRYKTLASHLPVSHRIKRFENVVEDHETGDVLGRYLNYYRGAPWFYVGLSRPTIPCSEAEEDTRKYGTLSVYSLVFGRGPKGRVERGEE